MFSSLLYIAILFYQNLYSVSNKAFNEKIQAINELVVKQDYLKATILANNLRQKSIYINGDLEVIFNLLSLKSSQFIDPNKLTRSFRNYNTDNEIIFSFLYTKSQNPIKAEKILTDAIKKSSNSDSLIRVFEIIKTQNINKNFNYLISSKQKLINKWNEKEAFQLLDMLKKNEKLLL